MALLKKKTFWYAAISSLVFITDIWIYFYLKDTATAAPTTIIKKQDPITAPPAWIFHKSEVQDTSAAKK